MIRPIPIHFAVEDELSEWVARRILRERSVEYAIRPVYGRGGYGYLKKNINAFNNASKRCPFLLLTDLDKYKCPTELITDWTDRPLNSCFLFRVAVREVESWVLGDTDGFAEYLGLRGRLSIPKPEELGDPKQKLLELAIKCPSSRRRDALAWIDKKSGRIHQGPDYNADLGEFVMRKWCVSKARHVCPSLEKLFAALNRLEEEY